MPTYDYICKNCGDTFEHFQKMTENHLKKCRKCGGELKRLIGTGLGPIFKGSGFYQTDYKSGGKPKTTVDTNTKKEKSKPAVEKTNSEKTTKKPE